MLNVSDTEIQFFKSDVEKFSAIDSEIKKVKKQIKPLQDKIKELTKLKQEKETEVLSFMNSNELDACNTDDASFEVKSSNITKTITKGDIYDRILKFFSEEIKKTQSKDPEEVAKTLYNYIYVENREKEEKKVLKSK
tara:strand:+ start:16 stop:426 length:411 start_codon:yes stop_codon:yes gene_type:complete